MELFDALQIEHTYAYIHVFAHALNEMYVPTMFAYKNLTHLLKFN